MARRTKSLMICGEEYMAIPEAVEYLGTATSTLYELLKSGKIRFAKVLSRTVISKTSIDEFLTSCIIAPEDARSVIINHRRDVKTDPDRKPGRPSKKRINRAALGEMNHKGGEA